MHVEVRHKALVAESKDKLCRAMFVQQEKEYFEADDKNKKINDENKLDTKEEYFDECDLESELEDGRDFVYRTFDS